LILKFNSAVGVTTVKVGEPITVSVGVVVASSFEQDAESVATNAKAAIYLNICFIMFLFVSYLFNCK